MSIFDTIAPEGLHEIIDASATILSTGTAWNGTEMVPATEEDLERARRVGTLAAEALARR